MVIAEGKQLADERVIKWLLWTPNIKMLLVHRGKERAGRTERVALKCIHSPVYMDS